MSKFLERQQLKYTSPEIQNEFLSIMALQVLRKSVCKIQEAVNFAVMIDETTDQSNKEQVVLVLCWVDDKLEAHEEFIGLYICDQQFYYSRLLGGDHQGHFTPNKSEGRAL